MVFAELLNIAEIISDRGRLIRAIKTIQMTVAYYTFFQLVLLPSLLTSNLYLKAIAVVLGVVIYLLIRKKIIKKTEAEITPIKEGSFRAVVEKAIQLIETDTTNLEEFLEEDFLKKWMEFFTKIPTIGWINGVRKQFEKYLIPAGAIYVTLFHILTPHRLFPRELLNPLAGKLFLRVTRIYRGNDDGVVA